MRLLKTYPFAAGQHELQLCEVFGNAIPPYAILSHTWVADADEEVLFADVHNHTGTEKEGFKKLRYALVQAFDDGFPFLWIDTCCVDKSSSAELSESINSMYPWYQNAERCYAYLADVSADVDPKAPNTGFTNARWWRRGWTLQELLAPRDLVFFSSDWERLGDKYSLRQNISAITGIDVEILEGSRLLESVSVAKRMSWASLRWTRRVEDRAYCLMGMFSVNMPMLYGEGESKAFLRLQEEIMKHSDDQSIFAWVDMDHVNAEAHHGLLADSPDAFARTGTVLAYHDWEERSPYVMSNRGLSIDLHLTRCEPDLYAAALNCPVPPEYNGFLAIYLKRLAPSGNQYTRVRCDKLGNLQERGQMERVFVRQTVARPRWWPVYPLHFFQLRRNEAAKQDYQVIATVQTDLFKADAKHIPPPTSHVHLWMPRRMPTSFKIIKGAHRLTAAILFQRRSDKESFAIMMGSIADFNVGFDVSEIEQLEDLEEIEKQFKPQPAGVSMVLNYHRVRVDVHIVISSSTVLYVLEIAIEAIPRDGAIDRLVSTGEVVMEPGLTKNHRKIFSLHR
ncbi:hypothetical protein LTR50_005926 [Elasticomyces elasticus]|nr:hypothetical protein LTR50_005926 [Elasticomyces elasticus]